MMNITPGVRKCSSEYSCELVIIKESTRNRDESPLSEPALGLCSLVPRAPKAPVFVGGL